MNSLILILIFLVLWGVWNYTQKHKKDYRYGTIPVLVGVTSMWIIFTAVTA